MSDVAEKEPPAKSHSGALAIFATILTAIGWFPVICILAASAIAQIVGCHSSESGSLPCDLIGIDVGNLISSLGLMGWFFILTWPAAAASAVLWFVVLVRKWQ